MYPLPLPFLCPHRYRYRNRKPPCSSPSSEEEEEEEEEDMPGSNDLFVLPTRNNNIRNAFNRYVSIKVSPVQKRIFIPVAAVWIDEPDRSRWRRLSLSTANATLGRSYDARSVHRRKTRTLLLASDTLRPPTSSLVIFTNTIVIIEAMK